MSALNVAVTIHSPKLAALSALLGGTMLMRAMGVAVKEKTVDYLRDLAGSRHDSANRVGGSYTGFYADRTQAVEGAALTVGSTEASFTVNHPGVGRAFHAITIVPKNGAQYIPIPLNALAYGRSPREFQKNIFIKKGAAKGGSKKEAKPFDDTVPAWLLVPSVTQPQDRTLLPSDGEWKTAAIDAAMALIENP